MMVIVMLMMMMRITHKKNIIKNALREKKKSLIIGRYVVNKTNQSIVNNIA